jgi:hypothetical protein
MNSLVTFAITGTVNARTLEVPNANFRNGANYALGPIGIATNGGVATTELAQSAPNWTLVDQREVARTPQRGQYIGGNGLFEGTSGFTTQTTYRTGTASASGNGIVEGFGTPYLVSLAAGWVVVV